ncbi:MAG: AMP-binding protein, partial [Thauera sp.]|nr:AMP-binding protein [Thauera sp.]
MVDVLEIVRALVAELRPGAARVDLDSHLERDLGLDSLARVELLARIEQASGLRLPAGTLTEAETPRQLQQALQQAHPDALPLPPAPVPTACDSGMEHVETPDGVATLVEVLEWHARRWPQRVHIHFLQNDVEVAALRYGELLDAAARVAGALQRDGLQAGQAVAIMLPTCLDFFISFCGALLAGGVPVPMYPPTRPSQLEDHLRRQAGILQSCGAPVLITVAEARLAARVLAAQVPSLARVCTPAELQEAEGGPRPVARSASDLALLQYTSGSTGNPKGVMLSHANLLANIRAWSRAIEVRAEDVCVSWLPLYHDMGLIGTWLGSLYNGNPLVLMSPLDFLSRPANWLRAIHRYRGTLSAAPNFAFELVVRHTAEADLAGLDLSCLRRVVNGAEPVSPDTLERFATHLGRHGFRREAMTPLYGLAENAVGLTAPLPGRGPRIDRVGRETFLQRARAERADGAADADTMRFVGCGRPLPG